MEYEVVDNWQGNERIKVLVLVQELNPGWLPYLNLTAAVCRVR